MKKNILILNGAARKNGNTASLIQAVTWYRTYEHNLGYSLLSSYILISDCMVEYDLWICWWFRYHMDTLFERKMVRQKHYSNKNIKSDAKVGFLYKFK